MFVVPMLRKYPADTKSYRSRSDPCIYPTTHVSRLKSVYIKLQLILLFSGNYGVPSSQRDEYGLLKYFESPNIQCAGVVVADYAEKYSHWTA